MLHVSEFLITRDEKDLGQRTKLQEVPVTDEHLCKPVCEDAAGLQ